MDAELLLRIFSEDRRRARRAYLEYMGERGILRREEVYATVDQRILGDEGFVEEVMGRTGRREVRGRRRHAYKLTEIAKATEEVCGITLGQLREKGRGEGFGRGRRLMSLVAKEYGYKGQEIAGYLWRDPSVITRYLKEGSKFASEVKNVHALLRQDSNKQV